MTGIDPTAVLESPGVTCPKCKQATRFTIHAYAEQEIEQDETGRRIAASPIRFTDIADEFSYAWECSACGHFIGLSEVAEGFANHPPSGDSERGLAVERGDGEGPGESAEREPEPEPRKTADEILRRLAARFGPGDPSSDTPDD